GVRPLGGMLPQQVAPYGTFRLTVTGSTGSFGARERSRTATCRREDPSNDSLVRRRVRLRAAGPLCGALREFCSRCKRRLAVGAHGAPARSGHLRARLRGPRCGAEPHVRWTIKRFGATDFAPGRLAGLPRRSSPEASEVWRVT